MFFMHNSHDYIELSSLSLSAEFEGHCDSLPESGCPNKPGVP